MGLLRQRGLIVPEPGEETGGLGPLIEGVVAGPADRGVGRASVKELWASPSQIGLIVLRTSLVYFFVLIGLRLGGKREVGQLAPFDFALILLIANAVQNAMVGPDTSLVGGMVAAGVLIIVNTVLGRVAVRSRRVQRLLRGRARVLVFRGHVQEENLKAESMSREDLLQALRENGCPSIEDCRLAVLEVDGTVSVVEKKNSQAHA